MLYKPRATGLPGYYILYFAGFFLSVEECPALHRRPVKSVTKEWENGVTPELCVWAWCLLHVILLAPTIWRYLLNSAKFVGGPRLLKKILTPYGKKLSVNGFIIGNVEVNLILHSLPLHAESTTVTTF